MAPVSGSAPAAWAAQGAKVASTAASSGVRDCLWYLCFMFSFLFVQFLYSFTFTVLAGRRMPPFSICWICWMVGDRTSALGWILAWGESTFKASCVVALSTAAGGVPGLSVNALALPAPCSNT